MPVVGAFIGLAILGSFVLLIRYLSRSGKSRTQGLAIGVIAGVLVATFATSYMSVYYSKPPLAIALSVLAWLVVFGLIAAIAFDVGRKLKPMLAVAGLFVGTGILFAMFAMSVPDFGRIFPHEAGAKQIGEAYGFQTFLPAGEEMGMDSKPVGTLEPDRGLEVGYKRFILQERDAEDPDTPGLEDLLATGATPFRGSEPIPADATRSTPAIDGVPGVAVEYTFNPKGEMASAQLSEMSAAVLVFEMDGTQVLMYSQSNEQLVDGKWRPLPHLAVEELVEIAERMEPVE